MASLIRLQLGVRPPYSDWPSRCSLGFDFASRLSALPAWKCTQAEPGYSIGDNDSYN